MAPLGTAVTREQLRLLKPMVDEVILLFDGDEAGVKAAERAVVHFLAEQMSGRVALLPQDHDPDTFIREFGVQRLSEVIESAHPLPEFVVQQFVDRHGESLDGKFRIIEELRPLFEAAPSGVQRDTMARHFGAILAIDPERLLTELESSSRSAAPRQDQEPRSKRSSGDSGLDGALKSVLGFMVRNPHHYDRLMEHEIDKVLAGTAGETICLQLKSLSGRESVNLGPEELFSELPPGEERTIVASILTELPDREDPGDGDSADLLEEVLGWLDRQRLKRRSEELMQKIREAEQAQDHGRVTELLQEKMKVDRDLKNS